MKLPVYERLYRLHAIIADVVIYFTSSLCNLYRVNTRRYTGIQVGEEKLREGVRMGTYASCIFRDSIVIVKWNAEISREAIE